MRAQVKDIVLCFPQAYRTLAQVKDIVLCFSQAYRTLLQVKDIVLCFPQAYRTPLNPQKVLVEPQKKPHGLYSQEGSLQPLETPKAAALKRWAMSHCSLSRQFTQLVSREFLAHCISSASSMGMGRELAQNTQMQWKYPTGCSPPGATPAVLEELRKEAVSQHEPEIQLMQERSTCQTGGIWNNKPDSLSTAISYCCACIKSS